MVLWTEFFSLSNQGNATVSPDISAPAPATYLFEYQSHGPPEIKVGYHDRVSGAAVKWRSVIMTANTQEQCRYIIES